MRAIIGWAVGMMVFAAMVGIASADEWQTDFAKASETAKKENKFMLLDFSGSDWCGWCMKLDSEVFKQNEFKTYAKQNLVCVLLDFPKKKAQSAEVKKQNEDLSRKYGIEGFPTIIVLSPEGELAGKTGYQPGGAKKYVENLKQIIDEYKKDHPDKAK